MNAQADIIVDGPMNANALLYATTAKGNYLVRRGVILTLMCVKRVWGNMKTYRVTVRLIAG